MTVCRCLSLAILAMCGAAFCQVTTHTSPEAVLVNQWFAEGTAAGNDGDYYDNRDRGHSKLGIEKYPQLKQVTYTAEEKKQSAEWGLARMVRPHPTIGNASLSASAMEGGSMPRQAYMNPRYREFLYKLYRGGNLFVFPEHRDHDPGANGLGGFGDLLPANTPYLVISQGSSGSDRVFINAFTLTLAAFRPDVKRRLYSTGQLVPAVQMIFRACNKKLAGPDDFLTGVAHPTVFEGKNVDAVKMVRMAHAMTMETLPPFAQIEVVDKDPEASEVFWDSPCAAVRVHRRLARDLHVTVSAEMSSSPGGEKLKYHWVVLRGDAEQISIAPRGDGAVADITVPWHGRRPVARGSKMQSTRVDIGLIVQSAHHFSPPAIFSVISLPNELRTYDDAGRLLDVSYEARSTTMDESQGPLGPNHPVADWGLLFAALSADARGLGPRLLQKQFKSSELALLRTTGPRYLELAANASAQRIQLKPQQDAVEQAWKKAREENNARYKALSAARAADKAQSTAATKAAVKEAAEAQKRSAADYAKKSEERKAMTKRVEEIPKPMIDLLTKSNAKAGVSPERLVRRGLIALRDTPLLFEEQAKTIQSMPGANDPYFKSARKRVVDLGVFRELKGGGVKLAVVQGGSDPLAKRMTATERSEVRALNVTILSRVLLVGALRWQPTTNYIDPRLGASRPARDVYRYDRKGNPLGRTHYEPGVVQELSTDGYLVRDRDKLGRPRTVEAVGTLVEVTYRDPKRGNALVGRLVFDGTSSSVFDAAGKQLLDKRSTGLGVKPEQIRFASFPKAAGYKAPYCLDVQWLSPDGSTGWTRHGGEAVQTFKREGDQVVGRDVRGNAVPHHRPQSVAVGSKSEKLTGTGKLLRYSYKSAADFEGVAKEVK